MSSRLTCERCLIPALASAQLTHWIHCMPRALTARGRVGRAQQHTAAAFPCTRTHLVAATRPCRYDRICKVEPFQRALAETGCDIMINGRRHAPPLFIEPWSYAARLGALDVAALCTPCGQSLHHSRCKSRYASRICPSGRSQRASVLLCSAEHPPFARDLAQRISHRAVAQKQCAGSGVPHRQCPTASMR